MIRARLRSLADAMANLGGYSPLRNRCEVDLLAFAYDALADRIGTWVSERTAALDLQNRLMGCATVEDTYGVIRRSLRKVYPMSMGQLYLAEPGGSHFARKLFWGDGDGPETFEHFECRAVAARATRPFESPRCPHVGDESMCIPLQSKGRPLGVLCIRGEGVGFDEQQRLLAEAIAKHIGLTLLTLRLRATLLIQSMRDPLTGLYNRRHLEETLAREIADAERTNGAVSVIVVDVDHFKRFNDRFGHAAGDAVLRSLGELLTAQVRASDIVCRFGGEEFVLVLSSATLSVARARAEALRLAVKQLVVTHAGQSLGALSISAGIAAYPRDGRTPEALFEAADEALYAAKRGGRDRVEAAGSSPPPEEARLRLNSVG